MKTFILFLFFSTLALSQNFTIRSLGAHGTPADADLFLFSNSAGALTKLSYLALLQSLDDEAWVWTAAQTWNGTVVFNDNFRINTGVIPGATGEWGVTAGEGYYLVYQGQVDTVLTWRHLRQNNFNNYGNWTHSGDDVFDGSIRIATGVIPDATGEFGVTAGQGYYLVFQGQLDTLMTWRQSRSDKIYGTMGFADETYVIAITQNVYASIRRTEAGSLWNLGVEVGDLVFTTDSIQVTTAGDYEIAWDLALSGANTDHFHVSIFVNNVEQSDKGESARDMTTTDVGSMSGHTILTIAATHWISLRITNTASGNDATMNTGNFNISKK